MLEELVMLLVGIEVIGLPHVVVDNHDFWALNDQ